MWPSRKPKWVFSTPRHRVTMVKKADKKLAAEHTPNVDTWAHHLPLFFHRSTNVNTERSSVISTAPLS
jgi:hypothetical protein